MTDISQAEFEVLTVLWGHYPTNANDIIHRLNQRSQGEREWHEKTVKTLLGRMVKKGAITFEKQGRTYLYTPVLELDKYTIKESESLIQRLFSGKITPLVAGFAKNKKLSKTDVDELKSFIEQWEKEND